MHPLATKACMQAAVAPSGCAGRHYKSLSCGAAVLATDAVLAGLTLFLCSALAHLQHLCIDVKHCHVPWHWLLLHLLTLLLRLLRLNLLLRLHLLLSLCCKYSSQNPEGDIACPACHI